MQKRTAAGIIIGSLVFLVALTWVLNITNHPNQNNVLGLSVNQIAHGDYRRWTKGGTYHEDFFPIFMRDSAFRSTLLGKNVDDLKALFPDVVDGENYANSSYRSQGIRGILTANYPNLVEPKHFWIGPGGENDFGYCAIVDGQVIRGFRVVKG